MIYLSSFGIRVMVTLQNEFGSFSTSAFFFFFFWKSLSRIGINSSLRLIEFTCEAIRLWAFVCWKIFDHSFDFSALISLFLFSTSFWFSLGRLYYF